MKVLQTIPVLRIFDYAKAIEFYIGWLGFSIVWEHHFEENTPVYMEVTKDALTLHLSEHHGDGTPGTHVFIWSGAKAWRNITGNSSIKNTNTTNRVWRKPFMAHWLLR